MDIKIEIEEEIPNLFYSDIQVIKKENAFQDITSEYLPSDVKQELPENAPEIVQFIIEDVAETNNVYQSNENPFKCPSCPKSFLTKARLLNHGKVHRQNKRLPCDICGKIFGSAALLTKHKKIHNPEKKFECGHCWKKFKTKSELKGHIHQVHLGIKKICKRKPVMFFCEKCGGIFSSNRDFRLHTMTVHMKNEISLSSKLLENLERYIENVPTGNYYLCTICDRTFRSKGLLQHHLTTHNMKEYKCSICGKILQSKKGYNIHLRKLHNDLLPLVQRDNSKTCTLCKKIFKTAIALKNHVWKIHPNSYKCNLCNRKMKTEITLKRHKMAIHKRL